ncbi:MAG: phosphoribosylanthranilate isomerase [Thermoproteota archaeon]|nr:phosphoribosylanthranilate isomerase [Thermoproteota archaeon]
MAVINGGADAVGFIVNVPTSPRNLSLKNAERLMRLIPIFVEGVVVTVPDDTRSLLDFCELVRPDAVQIHGDAQLDIATVHEKFPHLKLIKAIRVKDESAIEDIVEEAKFFDALLVDTFLQGCYGGTGETHDWNFSWLLREVLSPKPLILAGGLKPENVADAIRMVRPYAVDVSSGVESHRGRKDSDKVFHFIKNAKEVGL